MFQFFIAFLIGFLALIAGVVLYIWAMRSKGAGILFAKIFGIIVMVLSIVSMAGSIFYAIGYSQQPLQGAEKLHNIQKQLGSGHMKGGQGPSGSGTVVNPRAPATPVAVPNRSLNRELRRGGVYHKNH